MSEESRSVDAEPKIEIQEDKPKPEGKEGKPKRGRPRKQKEQKLVFSVDDTAREPSPFGENDPILVKPEEMDYLEHIKASDDRPGVKDRKQKILALYLADPSAVTTAIERCTNGLDVLSGLDVMSLDQLDIIQKAARVEVSKKINGNLMRGGMNTIGDGIDGLLNLNGHFRKRVSESEALPMLAQDAMTDSFIMMLPSWIKLCAVMGIHLTSSMSEAKKDLVPMPNQPAQETLTAP